MTTLPIGSAAMMMIVIFLMAGAKASVFINSHSFAIVVLGTVAVLFMSTPTAELKALYRALLFLLKKPSTDEAVLSDLHNLSKNKSFALNATISHPLVTYAQDLWVNYAVEKPLFVSLMKKKMDEENRVLETGVAALRNLAKYPPALGMTGTVVGLVTVFASLAEADRGNIGPALAVALTATFYGLLLANALIMPVADRLQVAYLNEARRNDLILKSLLMINNDDPIHVLAGIKK